MVKKFGWAGGPLGQKVQELGEPVAPLPPGSAVPDHLTNNCQNTTKTYTRQKIPILRGCLNKTENVTIQFHKPSTGSMRLSAI